MRSEGEVRRLRDLFEMARYRDFLQNNATVIQSTTMILEILSWVLGAANSVEAVRLDLEKIVPREQDRLAGEQQEAMAGDGVNR